MHSRKRPSWTEREDVKRRMTMPPLEEADGPAITTSSALAISPLNDASSEARTSSIGGGVIPSIMHPSLSASLNSASSPASTSTPYPLPTIPPQEQQPPANGTASQPPRPVRASPPGFLDIPKMPSVMSVALSAMQYLPTPLVVLSGLKTTVFANDAMGRLLGLDLKSDEETEEPGYSATNKLLGQSLGQIGVDLVQEGQPVWVNWEKFLDGLSQRSASRNSASSTNVLIESDQDLKDLAREASVNEPEDHIVTSPSTKRKRPSWEEETENKRPRDQSYVHDTVVDVVLSSQYVGQVTGSRDPKKFLPFRHVQARMVISIWPMDGQQFFTLTFSAASPQPTSHRSQVRMASRTLTGTAPSPTAALSANAKAMARCVHCGSHADPSTPPPRTSPNEMPLTLAPMPLSHNTAQPSSLQRTLKLKDAILNGMQIPKFAMWKDESVVVPNKAAELLIKRHTDPTSDETLDPLTRFQPWTDDFSRKLEPDENPIVVLCRTQKPFKSWKVGYHDKNGKRIVYDISGECLYDETGEFIGGITALKDVTDFALQLQEQSDRNEQQFEVICDCMPQIAWTTTPKGGHDWFSKRWYEYTGLTEEESFGEAWANTFHPDDMTETFKRWTHSLATGDEYVTEYRARSKTGEWRWMLGRALPLRDSKTGEIVKWFGTCTDIHELVQARQEQKRTHDQLLNVIDHAKVTVWSIDRQKVLTFLEGQLAWSPEATEGYRKGLIGQRIEDAFGRHAGGYDLRRYVKPIERILRGDLGEHVAEHHIDGTGRWYRTRFVPILGKKRQGGKQDDKYVDGVVGVSQDVSEMKMREQELETTEKENLRLLGAESAAKEASRLKSQFLANMSHEIRTPIAGVIGMAELLTDTPLDEDQRELAENIQRSANGLLTVINDILDLSKVESGRLDIEEVQFSLSVVLRDVGKMMSFAAERKGLNYEQHIRMDRGDDLIVLGDPGRCRQILTNLLTNSIKFTSEGSVIMSAWVKKESNDTVVITFQVEDTGIGIEEEVRKKLFKPFSQADSSTARRFGGTGLGLTICKNLVELMKGEIRLDSTLGQGTRAHFTIPFTKPQFRERGEPLVNLGAMPDRFSNELTMSAKGSERGTPPHTPADRIASHALAKKALSASSGNSDLSAMLPPEKRKDVNVLVVEDNHINQQIATRTIKKLGFNVNAVWNGKEALEYLLQTASPNAGSMQDKSGKHLQRPDVILMDVQMPILDGYRATHQIRFHDPYRKLPGMDSIPIVAMTASAIQGDREKCQKAGMDDYLSKPVNSNILEKMLVKWALRTKQSKPTERQESTLAGSSHSDHDSNCTETDVVISSMPPFNQATYPQAANKHSQQPPQHQAMPGSSGHETTPHQRSRLADSPSFPDVMSPPAESEGDRGLRRQAAEEKASALRDDKLVQAAESDDDHHSTSTSSANNGSGRVGIRRMHTGNPSEHVRSHSKVDELTEKNLGTMNRERGASDPGDGSVAGQDADEDTDAMIEGNEARPAVIARLHHETSVDSLQTNPGTRASPSSMGQGLKNRLNRGDSGNSERTVTPRH